MGAKVTLSTISLKPRCVVNREDHLIPWFCQFRAPGRKISRERPWYWVQILLTQQIQLCFTPDLSMEFRLSFSGNLTYGTQLIVTQTAALRAQIMASSRFSVLEVPDGGAVTEHSARRRWTQQPGWDVRVWAWWACAPPSLCLNKELSWDKKPWGNH